MTKILLITALVALLIYYISRRFMANKNSSPSYRELANRSYQRLEATNSMIQKITKVTMTNVIIGLVLFVLILLLAMKFKILLIALPISLYLLGQLFLLTNHVKATKNQQIWFNKQSQDVLLQRLNSADLSFNLLRDVRQVKEVKAVQSNRGVLFGYYVLYTAQDKIFIPYLIQDNKDSNQHFFDLINQHFKIEVETKLFPII